MYLATQRTPLPHISDSDPSALNIRIRASARSAGPIKISPSEPTPKCRSLTAIASRAGSAGGLLVKRVDIDVIVADAMHLREFHRRRTQPRKIDRISMNDRNTMRSADATGLR